MRKDISKLFYLGMILFLINCQSANLEQNKDIFLGDWAFVSSDTIYTELYISKTELMFYSEKDGQIGPFVYKLNSDSIFFNDINYLIKEIDKNQVLLSNNNYELSLSRIQINNSIDSNNINPFYLRRCNVLVNKGLISMEDAISYLNSIKIVE